MFHEENLLKIHNQVSCYKKFTIKPKIYWFIATLERLRFARQTNLRGILNFMKTVRKKKNYIDNKKFQEEMLKYHLLVRQCQKDNVQSPRANDYIGSCIYLIANRYATKPNFFGYSWLSEMISDGIENSIKYGLNKYDPTRFSNPIAYFTEIIHFSFVRRINTEKREQYNKLKLQQNVNLIQQLDNNKYIPGSTNETNDILIKDFEDKLKAKSEIKSQKNKKGLEKFIEE